jgi:hypothetical protein
MTVYFELPDVRLPHTVAAFLANETGATEMSPAKRLQITFL